jgi:hypothetical protein
VGGWEKLQATTFLDHSHYTGCTAEPAHQGYTQSTELNSSNLLLRAAAVDIRKPQRVFTLTGIQRCCNSAATEGGKSLRFRDHSGSAVFLKRVKASFMLLRAMVLFSCRRDDDDGDDGGGGGDGDDDEDGDVVVVLLLPVNENQVTCSSALLFWSSPVPKVSQ